MNGVLRQSLIGLMGGLMLMGGFAGSALATPPEDVPFWNDILNRLNTIEGKVDNIETKIDNQTTDLRGVRQNWDKNLDSTDGDPATGCNSTRFTCLWNNTVVRDNETGAVWDRNPSIAPSSWNNAIGHCANREVEGRKGFHLPTREQLATLVASSNNPALPTGHPFQNVQSAGYLSATTLADNPTVVWIVNFANGNVEDTIGKSTGRYVWCVRGGQSYDGQDVREVIQRIDTTHP